ncbi:MAG: type IV pilus secretin PilQ [Candidatus Omnitrophica bacterium]|nr:type IV pilus secretin PilQ [Candidatus Omnitrophota bacterium]MDD5653444.1 type IV pilus secretin PilQ [Candidatus Omnitrophota bacterium]
MRNAKFLVLNFLLFFLIFISFPALESSGEQVETTPNALIVNPEQVELSQNVTLDFKEADIRNVLKIISLKAGVNIVATPEVIGNVTIRLVDIPWERALDTIVKTYGFGYEWLNNKVVMVSTLEKLSQQRKAEEDAAQKEPLDTLSFTLNFTKAEDIKAAIEKLVSSRGKITLEPRTNTLLVTDTKSNLIKISEIVKTLDKVTPQVMIEAKIIETTLGTAEKLGIDWTLQASLSGSARPTAFPFEAARSYGGFLGKTFPSVQSPNSLETTDTVTIDSAGNTIETISQTLLNKLTKGFPAITSSAFTYGTLDFTQFKMVMEILDQRSDTKVLSNPRITTLNNREAKILVGSIVPIPNYEYSKDTGTRVVSGYTDQQIGIGLTVTPNINEHDYITLNIRPTIDQITGYTGPNNERPIISTRNAETSVMIKDNQTLVIGGLISEQKNKYKKKIPILGNIPLVGKYLFSKNEDTVNRTELMIFITPHIIRDKDFDSKEIAKLQQSMDFTVKEVASDEEKKKKAKNN